MKKSELFFNVLRVPVDFLMLLVAGMATYYFRTEIISAFRPVLFQLNLPFIKYFSITVITALVFMGCYAVSGLYVMRTRSSMIDELLKIIIGSSAGIMAMIIYIFLRQELFNSRFLVLGAWFFAIVLVALGRFTIRHIQRSMTAKKEFGVHRVLIIGNGSIASRIVEEITNSPEQGYRIVAQLADHDMHAIAELYQKHHFDEVLLANPSYDHNHTAELVDFCNENHCTFRFVPHVYETLTMHSSVDIVAGLPLIELKRTPLEGWGRVFKRVADMVWSILGIAVLSPIFLLIAALIKLDTKGPVFVALKRMSMNREFELYKFRSMVNNAHNLNAYYRSLGNDRPQAGPLWKMKDDPRITRLGRFLRRTRLDELPQLWNVLKGDMSLVGPRPHQPDEIAQYQKHHKKLLAIKAGATGMAQISGSSDLPFEEEVTLDSFYIEHWSLWLDMKIIFKTMFKMLNDHSAV
jgi:exopolysaccharide biosynthesis polyprenyl glycosylphosphotransferase